MCQTHSSYIFVIYDLGYHDFEYTIYMFLVFHCYNTGVAYTAQSIDINSPLRTSFNAKHHRPHYGSSSPPPTSHDLKCKTSRSPICDLWRWRKRAPLPLLAPPTTHYCTFQLAAVIIIFGLMCIGCNNITMGFGVFIWVKTQIQLVRSKPISVQAIFVFRIRRSTVPIYNHQSFGMFTLLVRNKTFM